LTKVSEQQRESNDENSQEKQSMVLKPLKDNYRAHRVKIKDQTSPHAEDPSISMAQSF
jgi:hypothetical protein